MTKPIHPMLERVAKAIAYEDCNPTNWRFYQRHTRAAIEALLEPDENDPAYFAGEYSRRNIEAYLKPLLGDEG